MIRRIVIFIEVMGIEAGWIGTEQKVCGGSAGGC